MLHLPRDNEIEIRRMERCDWHRGNRQLTHDEGFISVANSIASRVKLTIRAQVRQRDKGQKEGQVIPDRELLPEHDVLRNEDEQYEHAWHQPNDDRFRYISRNDSHRDGGDRTN